MTVQVKTKTIDGLEVKVQQFAGTKNLDLLLDLGTLVGPSVAAALNKIDTTKENLLEQEVDLAAVANTVFRSFTRENGRYLVRQMVAGTFVNDECLSEDQVFDRVFTGPALWTLPKILRFVLETNYGNFSELAKTVFGLISESVKNPQDQSAS